VLPAISFDPDPRTLRLIVPFDPRIAVPTTSRFEER
jgi:hypothetical protein